jgi:predicted outer membrane protein
MTRFLGTTIPGTNYIASASRMATTYAHNSKLRKIALDLAKDQTSVANSLTAWVNVSGPVVTRQNPYAVGGAGTTKIAAPRLLPDQVSLLQQLSQLRGASFDALYVSSVKETLGQLQTLFREFGEGGGDAGLRAIAKRELPKLEETISALNAM